jgi:hypothetical protein
MISLRSRTVRLFAAATVMGSGLGLAGLVNSMTTAHADPAYAQTIYVGVGSDTIQDLFNAYSGAEPTPGAQPPTAANLPTVYQTPLAGNSADGSFTMASFDAIDPHSPFTNAVTTITTKLGSAAIDRPNGSGKGRSALEDEVTGAVWCASPTVAGCQTIGGKIDFARSSSLGSTAVASSTPSSSVVGQLAYVPLASDGVSYAYSCANPASADCAKLDHLSSTDLLNLYTTNAGSTAGGSWGTGTTDTLAACGIQTGSGTFGFFGTQIGVPGTTQAVTMDGDIAPRNCHGLEENSLNSFDTLIQPPLAAATLAGATSLTVNPLSATTPVAFKVGDSITVGSGGTQDTVTVATITAGTPTTITFNAGQTLVNAHPATDLVEVANTDWVFPVSVGSVIGQHNGFSLNRSGHFLSRITASVVGIGFIDASGGGQYPYQCNGGGVLPLCTGGTWQDNVAYFGISGGSTGKFGRWLFVVLPSNKIVGKGLDKGLADLFYAPGATGGTAAMCSTSAKALMTSFGFDSSLPNNATSTGGTCGVAAYTGTN